MHVTTERVDVLSGKLLIVLLHVLNETQCFFQGGHHASIAQCFGQGTVLLDLGIDLVDLGRNVCELVLRIARHGGYLCGSGVCLGADGSGGIAEPAGIARAGKTTEGNDS